MKVTFDDVEYKVPDGQILMLKKTLNISAKDAAKIWLEDEGKLHNKEQEELCKKAKDSGVMRTIHDAKSEKAIEKKAEPHKPKTTKASPTKERIIADVAKLLTDYCENVTVTNKSKIIEFSLNGNNFKIDLTQKRK